MGTPSPKKTNLTTWYIWLVQNGSGPKNQRFSLVFFVFRRFFAFSEIVICAPQMDRVSVLGASTRNRTGATEPVKLIYSQLNNVIDMRYRKGGSRMNKVKWYKKAGMQIKLNRRQDRGEKMRNKPLILVPQDFFSMTFIWRIKLPGWNQSYCWENEEWQW